MGGKPSVTPSAPEPLPVADTPGAAATPQVQGELNASPYWPLGTPLSMLLYTSTELGGRNLDHETPLVAWDGLTYGGWNDVRDVDLLLDVPESVRAHNGSWFLDILLVKGGGTDLASKGEGDVVMYRKGKDPLRRR